jgi:hypothetical protein
MTNSDMQNDECRMQNEDKRVVCLVRDLLFYSKIRSAAATAGVELKSVRDTLKLVDEVGAGLLVDLNQDGALQAAIAWRMRTARPVVGFVSHVDGETIKAARAAGIDRVLVRSQFEQNLPGILSELGKP